MGKVVEKGSGGTKAVKRGSSRVGAARRGLDGTKDGFTLVEVMLVLGISGLMVIGLIAGLFSSIYSQRYSDAVRSFAEELKSIYNQVIRPEGLGLGNSGQAILGKVIVFNPEIKTDNGESQFYTATIVGDANINLRPVQPTGNILEELKEADASLYCGSTDVEDPATVRDYMALWQTRFMAGRSEFFKTDPEDEFKGTFIIARSPASNTVRTVYSKEVVYDLKDGCNGESDFAAERFEETLSNAEQRAKFFQDQTVSICVESDKVKYRRPVQVAADGRNSSAVSVLNVDDFEDGEENPCQ